MEHHNKNHQDKPIGAPHITEEETRERQPFEIHDAKAGNHQPSLRKKWANEPLWKKIVVIWFLIVCGFGVYDTIFPSEKSLKMEELLPIMASPTPVNSAPSASPSPMTSVSPTLSPSPQK